MNEHYWRWKRILIVCLALVSEIKATSFPELPIPPSDRVLTTEEVKNFWVHKVRNLPIPSKPSGLYPKAQKKWKDNLNKRHHFMKAVRAGNHDIQAELAQLKHNIGAWRQRGREDKAEATVEKLRRFQEHLARIELLKTQQQAAISQIQSAKKLKAIEAKLHDLRSSCSQACCSH